MLIGKFNLNNQKKTFKKYIATIFLYILSQLFFYLNTGIYSYHYFFHISSHGYVRVSTDPRIDVFLMRMLIFSNKK